VTPEGPADWFSFMVPVTVFPPGTDAVDRLSVPTWNGCRVKVTVLLIPL